MAVSEYRRLMLGSRWAGLVAALVLVFVVGLGSHNALGSPHARPLAVSTDSRSGSISSSPETSGLSFSTVEPRLAVLLVRPESRQASGTLLTTLLAVAVLAAATIGRRRPGLRCLLELAIRSQTGWWRPSLGGRAPPRAALL